MTDRLVASYPKPKHYPDHSHRPWRANYNLAYDGGGSCFSSYYRTERGAKVSIWWNMHISSWGGSAELVRQEDS